MTKHFPKHEQKEILENVDVQLSYEPTVETRNRKPMRPNSFAEWELRIGKFRVLYNVVEKITVVEIQRVGEKQRNNFFFRGQQEEL